MDDAAHYRRGFLITLLGVLIVTPDALLIRLIDTEPWTLTFWRGFLIPSTLLLIFGFHQGFDSLWRDFRSGGATSLALSGAFAGVAIFFVLSLHHTAAANVLVILASAPLFAAVMASVFLKEATARSTWIAILCGFGGIAIMVSEGIGGTEFLGDGMAILAAAFLALTLVMIRRRKDLNMVPAICFGGYIAAAISFPFAMPLALASHQAGIILFLCVLLLPISFGMISIGPRYLPAPEVGLLLLLETILGPLWIWLVLDEIPSIRAFVGGGIVVVVLMVHGIWKLTRERSVPAQDGLGSIFDGLDEKEIERLSSPKS